MRPTTETIQSASVPTLMLHFSLFLFVGVCTGVSLSYVSSTTILSLVITGIGIGCITSLLLRKHALWLRGAVYIALGLTCIGCVAYFFRYHPPWISLLEFGLTGLIAAQSIGAFRTRHYRLLAVCALLLVLTTLQHAGAGGTPTVIAVAISGITFLAVGSGTQRGSAARQMYISWYILVFRITLLCTITLLGGRLLYQRLPIIETNSRSGELSKWITYLQSQLRSRQPSPVTRAEPACKTDKPRDILNKHYAGQAVLDLSNTRPELLTSKIVFHVNAATPCYLRGFALDFYDGKGWSLSRDFELRPVSSIVATSNMLPLPDAPQYGKGYGKKCQIWVKTATGRTLYYPATARYLKKRNINRLHTDALGNLYTARPVKKGERYEYRLVERRESLLKETPLTTESNEAPSRYLQLPRIPGSVLQTFEDAVTDTTSRIQAVRQLIRVVQKGKAYTRAPQTLPPDIEATAFFISQMETASCGHFASALAVGCRAVEIPARVVVGYGPGEYIRESGMYRIREKDSHAWTQVWFPEIGWVNFDATPGRYNPDTAQVQDKRTSVTTAVSNARKSVTAWKKRIAKRMQHTRIWLKNEWIHAVYALCALIILCGLYFFAKRAFAGTVWRIRWIVSRFRQPRPAAMDAYRYCIRHLRARGLISLHPAATPTELVRSAEREGFPWIKDFASITTMAMRMIFDDTPPTEEEKHELRNRIRVLRKRIRT